MIKYNNIKSESLQYTKNTQFLKKEIHYSYISYNFYPKSIAKYGPQIELHSVLVYPSPSPDNFTRPLVAMVMTVCMSDQTRSDQTIPDQTRTLTGLSQ